MGLCHGKRRAIDNRVISSSCDIDAAFTALSAFAALSLAAFTRFTCGVHGGAFTAFARFPGAACKRQASQRRCNTEVRPSFQFDFHFLGSKSNLLTKAIGDVCLFANDYQERFMILSIAAIDDAEKLSEIRAGIGELAWQDGRVTAGKTAARVKENEQAVMGNAAGRAMSKML
ncbi:MAG: hypothetical protein ABJO05_13110, partial [Roseibium sp.]